MVFEGGANRISRKNQRCGGLARSTVVRRASLADTTLRYFWQLPPLLQLALRSGPRLRQIGPGKSGKIARAQPLQNGRFVLLPRRSVLSLRQKNLSFALFQKSLGHHCSQRANQFCTLRRNRPKSSRTVPRKLRLWIGRATRPFSNVSRSGIEHERGVLIGRRVAGQVL